MATRKTISAIGVMTGTSCDGADLALLRCDLGGGRVMDERFGGGRAASFPPALRRRLLKAQAGEINLKEYGALCRDYSLFIAALCQRSAKAWRLSPSSTVFGVHGQTLWHEPPTRSPSLARPGFTLQMIDGPLVSTRTGFVTVTGFRQPDMALGGQGAPLAPRYHEILARGGRFGVKPPLAVFNVGGIANLTYIGPGEGDIFAFDTGPGNALMDIATARHTKGRSSYDKGGLLGQKGLVRWGKVRQVARHPYFAAAIPKSTGRELFNEAFLDRLGSGGADLIAEATALTAYTMADSCRRFLPLKGARRPSVIYIAGGGARNPALVRLFKLCLRELCGAGLDVRIMAEEAVPGQYLEAMAFGRFAVEALLGHAVSSPAVTGAARAPCGAAICQSPAYVPLMKALNRVF